MRASKIRAWEFGERVKAARERSGLSQRALASKLGVDPTTVGNWERLGVVASTVTIRALASAPGATVEDLIG